jgi:adenine deaminase
VGILQQGDDADFITIDNLQDFNIKETYIGGRLVAKDGTTLIESVSESKPNIFKAEKIRAEEIAVPATSKQVKVIKALDGQLITKKLLVDAKVENGNVVSDLENDYLKLIVMNRYKKAAPAKAFIHGFDFKSGAIASTVAHDSHNIIAVGASDEDIVRAVNLLVESRGGVSLVNGREEYVLPLPVAGLMSADDGYKAAEAYEKMDRLAKQLGSKLKAPYMTLSFMALLVIPEIKLSDEGLFDGNKFEFTDLMC